MFPESRSGLIVSQRDANLAPSRIGHLTGAQHRIAKLRGVIAIVRQGLKLPKSWEREFENMGEGTVTMKSETEKEHDAANALRAMADIIDRAAARFSEDDEDERTRELARRYADNNNKRLSVPQQPSQDNAEVPREVFEYIEKQNARIRRTKEKR